MRTPLFPQAWTRFRRIALVGIETRERVTIDLDLVLSAGGRDRTVSDVAILEVKQWPYARGTPVMSAFMASMFAAGVNSGLAIEGNPGEQGIGDIIAGAVELSNTDVGKSLIDLILASTQYRSNTRVITSAQQLFDELLNLRR